MRHFNRMVLLLLAIALIRIAPADATGLSIKLGVVTKPGSAQNIVADKFKELVEARSGGDISVKIFHSHAIGNETEILQQIQMNTIQMGVITAGPFDTFDPIVRVVNYPFLFKDAQQADAILDGPLGKEILDALAASGFKGLSFSENGFRNLTNNKRPVKTPEDIAGLKVRVMSSTMHKIIWQTLGANPTPMPWPIYTELEQGVIDGQENPLWVIDVYAFYDIQKYMTLSRHVYSPHIDVASLSWWRSLDAAQQTLIADAIHEAAVYQRQLNRSKETERLAMLAAKGMVIEDRPDVDAFRKKVAGMRDMDLFKDPRVNDLLNRILEATK